MERIIIYFIEYKYWKIKNKKSQVLEWDDSGVMILGGLIGFYMLLIYMGYKSTVCPAQITSF